MKLSDPQIFRFFRDLLLPWKFNLPKAKPASYGSSFPFKEDLIQVIIMLIVGVIRVIRGKSRPPDGSTCSGPNRPNKMIHSFLQQWIIKKDYQVVFEKVPNI